eukprot:TRINITY_DN6902_c0_g2_i1.p1 TRINITY_DN6902_c0_g2~~TRINITY_DN6902_c0_g2_i1.p1  ORF type:complete len:925 (+),score=255.94 TRINITY_DN6902_c0_g2_i1:53-2776(+)
MAPPVSPSVRRRLSAPAGFNTLVGDQTKVFVSPIVGLRRLSGSSLITPSASARRYGRPSSDTDAPPRLRRPSVPRRSSRDSTPQPATPPPRDPTPTREATPTKHVEANRFAMSRLTPRAQCTGSAEQAAAHCAVVGAAITAAAAGARKVSQGAAAAVAAMAAAVIRRDERIAAVCCVAAAAARQATDRAAQERAAARVAMERTDAASAVLRCIAAAAAASTSSSAAVLAASERTWVSAAALPCLAGVVAASRAAASRGERRALAAVHCVASAAAIAATELSNARRRQFVSATGAVLPAVAAAVAGAACGRRSVLGKETRNVATAAALSAAAAVSAQLQRPERPDCALAPAAAVVAVAAAAAVSAVPDRVLAPAATVIAAAAAAAVAEGRAGPAPDPLRFRQRRVHQCAMSSHAAVAAVAVTALAAAAHEPPPPPPQQRPQRRRSQSVSVSRSALCAALPLELLQCSSCKRERATMECPDCGPQHILCLQCSVTVHEATAGHKPRRLLRDKVLAMVGPEATAAACAAASAAADTSRREAAAEQKPARRRSNSLPAERREIGFDPRLRKCSGSLPRARPGVPPHQGFARRAAAVATLARLRLPGAGHPALLQPADGDEERRILDAFAENGLEDGVAGAKVRSVQPPDELLQPFLAQAKKAEENGGRCLLVFHGIGGCPPTDHVVGQIASKGMDPAKCRSAVFGKGAYVATTGSKAKMYAVNGKWDSAGAEKHTLPVRVLVLLVALSEPVEVGTLGEAHSGVTADSSTGAPTQFCIPTGREQQLLVTHVIDLTGQEAPARRSRSAARDSAPKRSSSRPQLREGGTVTGAAPCIVPEHTQPHRRRPSRPQTADHPRPQPASRVTAMLASELAGRRDVERQEDDLYYSLQHKQRLQRIEAGLCEKRRAAGQR